MKNRTHKLHVARSGIRYAKKTPPIWIQINLLNGHCWCGKPKELWKPRQRKHCSTDHGYIKYYYITMYWDRFRTKMIERDNHTCVICGYKNKDDRVFDVDHIQSIALGGECFDENNVRTLCKQCHKAKTKQDSQERAKNKRTKHL